MSDSIPFTRSVPDELTAQVVQEILHGGLLHAGHHLRRFEQTLVDTLDRSHAIGISSPSAALQLTLAALGIGQGDEVIVPALFSLRAAGHVRHMGAVPILMDCDPRTMNLPLDALEAAISESTRAIIVTVPFGNPVGMVELTSLCTKHEITMIEDAGTGLGSSIGTDMVGRFGRVSLLAFPDAPGAGRSGCAAIVTHDSALADTCRALRDTDISSVPEHGIDEGLLARCLNIDARLDEISAALASGAVGHLEERIELRTTRVSAYTHHLSGLADLSLPTIEDGVRMNWSRYVVRLSDRYSREDRDEIIAGLWRHDIESSSFSLPAPLTPPWCDLLSFHAGHFPVARSIGERILALPIHDTITERDVDLVCQTLELMMTQQDFHRE